MRLIRSILIAGLFLALRVVEVSAEEPAWSVKVEMLMVSVQPSTSLTLLPNLREEKSIPTAIAELWKLIEDGDVEVLGWPVTVAETGQRTVAETIEYVTFPTEFNPVIGPGNLPRDPFPPPSPRDWRSVYSRLGLGPITPDAFETRSVGEKLEVEAAVEKGGGRIQLNVSAECVRVLRFKEFAGTTALNGVTGVDVRPEFATSRFTSALTARSGEWLLFSSFIQPQPKPHMILFLLRAASIARGPEKLTK